MPLERVVTLGLGLWPVTGSPYPAPVRLISVDPLSLCEYQETPAPTPALPKGLVPRSLTCPSLMAPSATQHPGALSLRTRKA